MPHWRIAFQLAMPRSPSLFQQRSSNRICWMPSLRALELTLPWASRASSQLTIAEAAGRVVAAADGADHDVDRPPPGVVAPARAVEVRRRHRVGLLSVAGGIVGRVPALAAEVHRPGRTPEAVDDLVERPSGSGAAAALRTPPPPCPRGPVRRIGSRRSGRAPPPRRRSSASSFRCRCGDKVCTGRVSAGAGPGVAMSRFSSGPPVKSLSADGDRREGEEQRATERAGRAGGSDGIVRRYAVRWHPARPVHSSQADLVDTFATA